MLKKLIRDQLATSGVAAPALLSQPRNADQVRLTFVRSAARGLNVPARLTPELAKHEARKRRGSERPRVGCCEKLGGRDAMEVYCDIYGATSHIASRFRVISVGSHG